MASVTSILQNQPDANSVFTNKTASGAKTAAATASSTSSSASSATSSTATITANDFLTLLVTELKNQDPTSNTDPNEYVNQLCEVNSLEQLVSINSTLTNDLGSSTSTSGTSGTSGSATTQSSTSPTAQAQAAYHANALAAQSGSSTATAPTATPVTSGNLNVPATSSSSLRVANALSSPYNVQ